METEPNDSTTSADAALPVMLGQVMPARDVDHFSVVTTVPNTVLTAEVASHAGSDCVDLDSEVAILDRNGTTTLGFNDDINPNNLCSRATAFAVVPGTYFFRVRASQAFSPTATFDYQLLVTSTPPTEAEPNNTVAQASPFVSPFYGAIAPANDIDVIRVDTTVPNTTVIAEVADLGNGLCSTGAMDSVLRIVDRDGTTTLAENDDINAAASNFCSRATALAAIPGSYFIRVQSLDLASSFPYRLLVTAQ